MPTGLTWLKTAWGHWFESSIAHHPHVVPGHIEKVKLHVTAGLGNEALRIADSVDPQDEKHWAFLLAARRAARREFGQLWMDSFSRR